MRKINPMRKYVSRRLGHPLSDFQYQVLQWKRLMSRRKYTFRVNMTKSETWGNPRGSFYKFFGYFEHDSKPFIKKGNECWLYLPRATFRKELQPFPALQRACKDDEVVMGFVKKNHKKAAVFKCEVAEKSL